MSVSRPGVSVAMLARAGVRHVRTEEALAAVGYSASGLLLPYVTRNGAPVTVNGKPFARLRLDAPTVSAKYLSPGKSGCQLYEPPGLQDLLRPEGVLGVVEGEFKSLALVEAGFPCVGIGGISSACPGGELLPALASLIAEVRPSRLAFIGDGDTALIPAFSHEAVKLAKLAGAPVVLPRIPCDALGKGPDDLRESLGPGFPEYWRGILAAAENVTPDTTPAALAVRLLRRESDALARLQGDAFDQARERIVKLAAAFEDEALVFAEVEEIAAGALRMARKVFRSAVKRRAEDQRKDAAERTAAKAIESLGPDGETPLFFDGCAYWRREADGAFGRLTREDARLDLNKRGLSKNGDPSPCDAALHELQTRNRVDYAGPLCGRPPGLHLENGLRVLATRGPVWIAGNFGECPTIFDLVLNLLGRAAGDAHTDTQAGLFLAWLKLAREAVRHPERHSPGQVLALVGPPDCGKSLLQSLIITPALGGRAADPGLFFTGKTDFNADLWGAEHLSLGDKALDVDGSQRDHLRNELKRVVAADVYPLHGKGRDGLTFRPVWRVSLSANDDPESASNLPALDAAFADKIIYLKCYTPPAPFHDSDTPGAREAFAQRLGAELPAFLGYVDGLEIPAHLRKARFGVKEWHHPAVIELLGEGDPLRPVAEVLEGWIDGWKKGETARELPTTELYPALDQFTGGNLGRHKISTGPLHLGRQLARLASAPAWSHRLAKAEFRVGGREANRLQRGWRISK